MHIHFSIPLAIQLRTMRPSMQVLKNEASFVSVVGHRRGVTNVGGANGAVWNADILRGGSSMMVGGAEDGELVGTVRECTMFPVTIRQMSFLVTRTDLAREKASSGCFTLGARCAEADLLSEASRDARMALNDMRVSDGSLAIGLGSGERLGVNGISASSR